MSRAAAQNRDFNQVLNEVEFKVSLHLAIIMEKTIDPTIAGTAAVTVEEDSHVCGVCQEDMQRGDDARAMDCMHVFHHDCILHWLHRNNTCPLCRHVIMHQCFFTNSSYLNVI
ncbi:hypothetical protein Ddye_022833 [Dipteronia dyeriana]|uniref:RING-type E3 ubiquitin transferase n=1 Tax=Dipteronia dyeriana TaxID=168575 RepID=A0AAD9WST9_9ROSI|nr:hypothetical protein Ddye_022833 [Dipteronia dyeriana]